jgi:glycine oxidase
VRLFAADVVIIGGGIIGLTTAYELLQRGLKVTLIERGHCGHEASWAGGGILSPLSPWHYPDPVTSLSQFSNTLFPDLVNVLQQKTGIDTEFRTSGVLALMDAGDHLQVDSSIAAWCRAHPLVVKRLYARDIAPELACNPPALWLPEITQIRNPRLLQALKKAVASLGGKIVEQTTITGWKIERNKIIAALDSSHKEFPARDFIIAAGAWSRELLSVFVLKLSIWPVRGQMMLFRIQPDSLSTIILQDSFYLIPRQDGHILAGSTTEETGFNKSTTSEARETLLAKAHALLPALTAHNLIDHWAGLRPGSPDNIPVIDRHPALGNLYISSGHHRYGVTMAPGSARLMANMLLEQPQPIDVTPYQWPV